MENKDPVDPRQAWKAALGAAAMTSMLGWLTAGLSYMSRMQTGKYMTVFYAYDDGALLFVLTVFGVICAMGGGYGAVVCSVATNRKKLKRLQLMVRFYVGWGAAQALLCFVTFLLIKSCSSSLNKLFWRGFSEKISEYASDDRVRDSIDNMQREVGCCGSFNMSDWFTVIWSANVSMTENSVPESCCDRRSFEVRGLSACLLSVPFGEGFKLSAFTDGCANAAANHFGSILNIRGLMIVGCGILQALATGLIVVELKHVYEIPDADNKEEEKTKLIDESDTK